MLTTPQTNAFWGGAPPPGKQPPTRPPSSRHQKKTLNLPSSKNRQCFSVLFCFPVLSSTGGRGSVSAGGRCGFSGGCMAAPGLEAEGLPFENFYPCPANPPTAAFRVRRNACRSAGPKRSWAALHSFSTGVVVGRLGLMLEANGWRQACGITDREGGRAVDRPRAEGGVLKHALGL